MSNEFWVRVLGKTLVAKDTYEVSLSYPTEGFSFLPGQYIWVVLPSLNSPDPRGERRAYSICSASSDHNKITIIFRNSASGYKKTLLSFQVGTNIKIIGPFGSSYIIRNKEKHIVMIAGGVGIAPFLSILRSTKKTTPSSTFSLISVNSSKEACIYGDELKKITTDNDISFVNHIGRFSEQVLPAGIDFKEDIFFVCGPMGMVDTVYQLLHLKQIPLDHMHFEQHYPTLANNLTEDSFVQNPGDKNIMQQAVQDSRNHIIITDSNGLIIFANKRAQENTGYTFDEMRGNTPRLWGGLMPLEFYEKFWRDKYKAQGFDGELMNRRKNGEIYYVLAHISPIIDEKNNVIGYIGTEEDITVSKNTKEDILKEKIRNEAILSSIGDGVVALDVDGNVMFVNQSAENLVRWSKEELVGKKWIDCIPLLDNNGRIVETTKRPFTIALQRGKKVHAQCNYLRKDNTSLPVSITVAPIILSDKSIGAIEVFRDITQEAQIDKTKTEFISLASHQLRTPITTINWYCEMLLDGDAGEVTEEQKKLITEAYAGSLKMGKLVNALLNVSRIELGTYMIDPQNIDIVKLTQSVLDESKPQIDEKQLTVKLENEEIPQVILDPNLTTIILQNLLTNSIKYTLQEGQITLFLKQTKAGDTLAGETISQNSLLIAVSDNGIGIPERQKDQIFQKSFRADNVRQSNNDGTGLGLYLVKSLIEHCGGKIWFTSQENKGTIFYVLLPMSSMSKKEGTKQITS